MPFTLLGPMAKSCVINFEGVRTYLRLDLKLHRKFDTDCINDRHRYCDPFRLEDIQRYDIL